MTCCVVRLLLTDELEVLHEVAHGEVRGVALPTIAELFAQAQRLLIGRVEREHAIADARERTRDQQVLRHRQARHEDGRVRLLGRARVVEELLLVLLAPVREPELHPLVGLEARELGVDVDIESDIGRVDRRSVVRLSEG